MNSQSLRRDAVGIDQVVKIYGEGGNAVTALKGVSLAIADNEFFTLLGPSGCGKTTLLRIIAGFEQVSGGRVFLFGDEIEQLPPNKRPVNTVFQHYALFPHMTVEENIAFGLKRLGRSGAELRQRVGEMMEITQLSGFAGRRPGQLSGGQQQRVALARALAPQPKILLLDEPLSALDLKLRQQMRLELKQIQENTGITFIFVTHDQEEALAMSDRIAVMSQGEVQQLGTAEEIYERPSNRFVADFIGDTNILAATILAPDGTDRRLCRTAHGLEVIARGQGDAGASVHISIRPERIALAPAGMGHPGVPCVIDRIVYLGTNRQVLVRLNDGARLTVLVPNASNLDLQPGDNVLVQVPPGTAQLLKD
ncbi:ABC transporter ATP-binding protein [Dongia sp.]|uniref:ABC transporter ATP-binding protein n=1 Tax=Dongia sp. TaxID=1977262 RepID=UPI0035B2E6C3